VRRMSAGLPPKQTSCNAPLFSILAEHGIGSVSQRKCLLKRFNTMLWSCTATTFGSTRSRVRYFSIATASPEDRGEAAGLLQKIV
jgi:hypothetical protein